MNKTIMILLVFILMAGCKSEVGVPQKPIVAATPAIYELSECEELAIKLDNNLGKGIITGQLLVGGTLLNISGPLYAEHGEIYADMPPEYHYNLTFRGKDKNPTFHFYSLEPIKVPLVEGHFYKFDLPKAFGLVGSSGPHSSMFAAEDLGNFVEVTC